MKKIGVVRWAAVSKRVALAFADSKVYRQVTRCEIMGCMGVLESWGFLGCLVGSNFAVGNALVDKKNAIWGDNMGCIEWGG